MFNSSFSPVIITINEFSLIISLKLLGLLLNTNSNKTQIQTKKEIVILK